MTEHCPIRTIERISPDTLVDVGIPAKCMGCLALALSGKIPSRSTESDSYDQAVLEMVEVDDAFNPDGADRWSSTRFAIPSESPARQVRESNGFEDFGGDNFGAVCHTTTVSFDCVVERA
jgi:hypothetical protein